MIKQFTREFLYESRGCYSAQEVDVLPFLADNMTAVDVINSGIPLQDKFWFICNKLATRQENVFIAASVAELVLGIYEKQYPGDDRPRKAIEVAKLYGKEGDPDAATDAADAAYAAGADAYASDTAAYAAYSAAGAAYAADGFDAARASARAFGAARAAHAAYSAYATHATHAAYAVYSAATAAYGAAYGAAYAADDADAADEGAHATAVYAARAADAAGENINFLKILIDVCS